MPGFTGVGVALLTLFDSSGGLDAPATAALAAVPATTPVIAGARAPSARRAVRLTRDALGHPEACLRAFAGDVEAQRALAEPDRVSRERFPAGLKEMVAARFGTSTRTRSA